MTREAELTALVLSLAERVYLQSEILRRTAEKPMKKITVPERTRETLAE